jgi:hypothetical protein
MASNVQTLIHTQNEVAVPVDEVQEGVQKLASRNWIRRYSIPALDKVNQPAHVAGDATRKIAAHLVCHLPVAALALLGNAEATTAKRNAVCQ